jgi:RNA recognition motif-containing protein
VLRAYLRSSASADFPQQTVFNPRPNFTGRFFERLKMSNKLYVGNLSYSVRDDDLQQQFSSYGHVQSAKVMMERDTGRSKGFGFVEMSSSQEAEAAIRGMHGQNMGGRDLTVNIARPMEARPPRSSGY